jgi:hypothetical protein
MRLRLRSEGEAKPRLVHSWTLPERQSLSALCGGEAAKTILFQVQSLV